MNQSKMTPAHADNSVAATGSAPESGRMAAVPKPVYAVSVRELVEFALRRGDLGGERDFVSPRRALAGTRGHQRIQRSRPAGYEKEVAVVHDFATAEFILRVQGRIDGLRVTPEEVLLEEIKTVQAPWDGVADPLHWAQAKCYGFICAHTRGWPRLTLQLTYLELETNAVTELRETCSAGELAEFFHAAMAIYGEWIQDRHRWCARRDASIRALEFPFPSYRPGQRELAVAAYRALARGGRLFLEAPTGIGKTVSVIYPALKALGEGRLERVFYLTARTVGRTVAEKAFADLRRGGLELRTLTLTAKEKLCVQAGQPCDPQTCPLARGYYDRRHAAMRQALTGAEITRPVLEAVSQAHAVCPFELALDLSTWVDAVVCDYNYVFDPQAYLRRHFGDTPGDYAFLIDEAHHLVDRAREMFSADLDRGQIRDTRRAIKSALPRCARALSRLSAALGELTGAPPTPEPREPGELDLFPATGEPRAPGDGGGQSARGGVRTLREFPAALLPPLESALDETEAWLARNQPAEFREPLLELYFHLRAFQRTAGLYDERFVTLVEPGAAGRVRLFCLDPFALLRQALARGKAAVCFSATLSPPGFFRELLGGAPDDPTLQLPSPFPPEHLAVLVQDRIRTDFKARGQTLADVAQAIAATVAGRRGNYLAYFPSFAYLAAVQEEFQRLHPAVRILAQQPGLSEAGREAFLAAFAAEHAETLVGFAVMGGVFGEGIDLVGDRLIGAIIVGVGLPQLCAERDLIRDFFEARHGSGFDYAYAFPGMNRVLQAVGRVIRSETDRGVVLLIDTRFREPRYRRLFPRGWRWRRVREAGEIRKQVRQFWQPAAWTREP